MITQEEIKELFNYRDGSLYWKHTSPGRKLDLSKAAGTLNDKGYVIIRIEYKAHKAHRLIFLMHRGYLPKRIDHIDLDRSNNRIKNLRPCSNSQNCHNAKLSKRNNSGVKGVCWCKTSKSWDAGIRVNGRKIRLGRFHDKEVAAQIIRIARLKYHGEFANHG